MQEPINKKRIPISDLVLGPDDLAEINDILKRQRISEGVKTKNFERQFADFIGTKYAVAFNSGTSAMIAGMTSLKYLRPKGKISPGNKVITTPLTYIATSNSIVTSGFEPVYVDIEPRTFTIPPENVRTLLENTNAKDYSIILPVHLMGYPNDMDGLNKIAKDYNLVTFEDAAEATGTMLPNGKKAGSDSLLADFSFYIAHIIQAGELGVITTDDLELKKMMMKVKANGRMCDCDICVRGQGKCPHKNANFDPRFTHEVIGYNFKAMDFQTAIGIAQLRKADWIIKTRNENLKLLNSKLKKFSSWLTLPLHDPKVSYLAYPIVIKKDAGIDRKQITSFLEENNIETRPLFGCIPTQQPAYSKYQKQYEGKLPNADFVGKNGFYIGVHQYMAKGDIEIVASVFEKFFEGR